MIATSRTDTETGLGGTTTVTMEDETATGIAMMTEIAGTMTEVSCSAIRFSLFKPAISPPHIFLMLPLSTHVVQVSTLVVVAEEDVGLLAVAFAAIMTTAGEAATVMAIAIGTALVTETVTAIMTVTEIGRKGVRREVSVNS